jgi:hypothetical protein
VTEIPDSWVAVQPLRAFRSLGRQPLQRGTWLGLRRPLFAAFVLGCCVTLIAAEPFDPRLVASNLFAWAFVPCCETAALGAVVWSMRKRIALSQAIDLYFTGHAPWLLWFTALSVDWSLQGPHRAGSFMFSHFLPLAAGTLGVMAWSCYVDFCCLHAALGRTRRQALRDLIVQRLISWSLITIIFGWASLPADIAGRLHIT